MEREEKNRGSSAYTRGQVLNAAAVATAAKPSQFCCSCSVALRVWGTEMISTYHSS